MMKIHHLITTGICVASLGASASALELTTNGDFELGDTSGWESFPTGATSTFDVTTDANSGTYAGVINNIQDGTGFVVKQANLGAGLLTPGETIDLSFAAKANLGVGGVTSIVLFSEVDGGGVSASYFPPATITETWQNFSFSTTAGPDVSGGVTFQFVAITGAFAGSTAELFIDDVSVSVVPEPASVGLLGLGALALLKRRK